MTLGKYRNLGLRRDNNLSDVEDPYESLKNIIDNLAGAGEVFVPEDLEPINGIRNTTVTNAKVKELQGTAIRYTDETRQIRFVSPLITIKDTVDNAKVITGDPPFLSGGDGPLAIFTPSDNILANPTGTTRGDQLIVDPARNIGPTYFWDNGIFQFVNKIYPTFDDGYGLIQWEGYIALDPILSSHVYTLRTSGLSLVEIDFEDNGTWETLSSIYSATRSLSLPSADLVSVSAESVTLTNTGDVDSIMRFIAEGDQLISINGVDVSADEVTISDLGTSTIVFDKDVSGYNWTGASVPLTFSFEIGGDGVQSFYTIPDTFYDDKIKIRYTVWWPDPGDSSNYENLYAVFRDAVGDGGAEFLPFYYLYSEKPPVKEPDRLSIEFFYKNNLTPWSRNTNASLTIDNSVIIQYDPPLERDDRYKGLVNLDYSGKGRFTLGASGTFSDLEKGDYICLSNAFIQVSEIIGTTVISPWFEDISELPVAFTGAPVTSAAKFNYNGLVGIYNYNSVGNTMTAISSPFDVNDIQRDHVVISPTTTNAYRISGDVSVNGTTATVPLTEIPINAGQPAIGSSIVAVYRDKGLEDRSKDVFCQGVFGKRVSTQAGIGATSLVLDDVTGVSPGQFIQFDGVIAADTIVSSIAGTTVNINNGLLDVMSAGATVTFSPDNVNREICIVALDTAPPFVGTSTGLETAPGIEGIRGNTIGFKELLVNDMPQSSVNEVSPTGNAFTETLSFTSNGSSYRFLIF